MNFESSMGLAADRLPFVPMKLRCGGPLRQTPLMSLRSRGLRLLLAALLIFSQHQAVLHLLGHGVAQLTQKESTDPSELVCAKCLAIAHLDHAVGGHVTAIEPIPSTPERVASVPAFHFDLAFFASYRSRAPPVLS